MIKALEAPKAAKKQTQISTDVCPQQPGEHWIPNPAEIRRRTAEIRREWSPSQRRIRAAAALGVELLLCDFLNLCELQELVAGAPSNS